MAIEAEVTQRAAQPYVGVAGQVAMASLGSVADRIPEIFGWLAARGIAPAGPPFFRYNVIDMERQLEVEAGVPVASAVDGDGRVQPGTLPAGRYATLLHVGAPPTLPAGACKFCSLMAEMTSDGVSPNFASRWGLIQTRIP